MGSRRDYYFYTNEYPGESGYFPLEGPYLERIKPGDGLWLIGKEPEHYKVRACDEGGVFLDATKENREAPFGDAPFGEVLEGGEARFQLPAMRHSTALIPSGKPLAVEVEHKESSGPGEMIIELYSKDGDGYKKQSTDDSLDDLMEESFRTLLKLQIKTLESTSEIGDLWIKYLKYKQRGH